MPTLRGYLKHALGMRYRSPGLITPEHNLEDKLLQRQYAAAQYIGFLTNGKTLLNIDESSLRSTDHRKRGWVNPKKKNYTSVA